MREILTLSLPAKTKEMIKKRVAKRGFTSISQYVKFLFDQDSDDSMISEEELLKAVKEAEEEYRQGKTIKAKSMADLL